MQEGSVTRSAEEEDFDISSDLWFAWQRVAFLKLKPGNDVATRVFINSFYHVHQREREKANSFQCNYLPLNQIFFLVKKVDIEEEQPSSPIEGCLPMNLGAPFGANQKSSVLTI